MDVAKASNRIYPRSDFPCFCKGLDRLFRMFPDLTTKDLSEICELNCETIRNWRKKSNKIKEESTLSAKDLEYCPYWYSIYHLLFGLANCMSEVSLDFLFNGPEIDLATTFDRYDVTFFQEKLNLCSGAMDTIMYMNKYQLGFLEGLMQIPEFFPKIMDLLDSYTDILLCWKTDLEYLGEGASAHRANQIKQYVQLQNDRSLAKKELLTKIRNITHGFMNNFSQHIETIQDLVPQSEHSNLEHINFSAGLSRLMKQEKLNVEKFAKLFDVSPATVRSWLSPIGTKKEWPDLDNIPTLKTVGKICTYFDIDMDYLFHISGWRQKENWCIARVLGFSSEETILWLSRLNELPSETLNSLLTDHWDKFSEILDMFEAYTSLNTMFSLCEQQVPGKEINELVDILLSNKALVWYFSNFLATMDRTIHSEDTLPYDAHPYDLTTEDPDNPQLVQIFTVDPVSDKYGSKTHILAYDFDLAKIIVDWLKQDIEEGLISLFSRILDDL